MMDEESEATKPVGSKAEGGERGAEGWGAELCWGGHQDGFALKKESPQFMSPPWGSRCIPTLAEETLRWHHQERCE